METVTIEGYLTQSKLKDAVKQLVGDKWIGSEYRIPGYMYRWDIAYWEGSRTVLVEFDGEKHYRDSLRIRADRKKDALAAESGFGTIRIPYWVQLTDETVGFYFGIKANIIQDFPHGFIDPKAHLPASFCALGVDRFLEEYENLPHPVKVAVTASLKDNAERYGLKFVLPPNYAFKGCLIVKVL